MMTDQVVHTKTIDEYSFAAKPALFCNANVGLAIGTVFFWSGNGMTYLVTNWHNVTGRNPQTGIALSQAGRPTRFEVSYLKADNTANFVLQSYRLYDKAGLPLWLVHPEHGPLVDVVALPIEVPQGFNPHPINTLSSAPLKIRVGHDLFVLGFPFAKSVFDGGGLPIWKRGSLASEPDWMIASQMYSLVDTASRQGMSGAPVVRRAYSGAELENGEIHMGGATSFYGVYAGRLHTSDSNDAQLGRVYGRKLLEEIISAGVRDTKTEMPFEPEFTEELVSLKALSSAGSIAL